MTALESLALPIPTREPTPESLAAWYSGFSFAEHYRKVVLAGAKEAVRAQATADGEKVTEARLDDLARLHPSYLEYLAFHLEGRMAWERTVLERGGA